MADSASPTEDQLLMGRVQANDEEAMRTLFVRHQSRLYGFFFSHLGARDRSEDLVQEAFIRLWRFRDRYDATRPFLPWIFRIARNLMADAKRPPIHSHPSPEIRSHGPGPEESFERARESAEVRKAVLALPASQREALLLSRWSGMTYREVAEALGCSEGAVKARIFRAMETLRALLKDA